VASHKQIVHQKRSEIYQDRCQLEVWMPRELKFHDTMASKMALNIT
jgi:hypothetical protein